jgi:hypothetical protein
MPKPHPLINTIKDDQLFCIRCEAWKNFDEFAKAPRMKRGYHSWCRACLATYNEEKNASKTEEERERRRAARRSYQPKYMREWREKNPDKAAAQALKYRWGLTPEQFQHMLAEQQGECLNPSCSSPATDLDHDHSCCPGAKSCGQCIRGILCHRCNVRLGWIEKDLDLVRGLLSYRDTTLR